MSGILNGAAKQIRLGYEQPLQSEGRLGATLPHTTDS
jgi:hypothetical protein